MICVLTEVLGKYSPDRTEKIQRLPLAFRTMQPASERMAMLGDSA